MKVCDVVLNSIWYDPRVRKQLTEYRTRGIDVCAVGLKCNRYDETKLSLIPCRFNIVQIDSYYDGKQYGIRNKLMREKLRYEGVRDAIIEEKPDVIHANDLNALIPAYAAARKLRCRLVYDSHEINVENYTTDGRSPMAAVMEHIERYIVQRVDLMVCVSHAAADYFAKKYQIPKPMVVTNCSLRTEMADAPAEKHAGFEVLNHGQFYAGRGYDTMVQACALLADYAEIKLAARGFGRMEAQLREMAEGLKNPEQFRFYPPVNVQELIPMAARSHVGVAITVPICLNFKLSVSNKLFEYASAGLPVIMSDIPEHRYLNEKYHFGLILKEDTPECLAEAAICLYTDKALYQTLAENARAMSAEVNWETEFGRLIEAEREMLK